MRVASLPGAAIRRCLGLVRHRPESWAVAEWERAYSSGQLAYFSDMDELARYSLLAGYVRYIGERPDILDIGCGEGLLRRHLDGVPIGHYTGIDLCSTAIARARGLRDGFTTFLCADVMSTELASADLIVLNEVLYFADDPTAMLERIAGLLRPDGHLLVSIWRHAGDRHLWSNLRRHFRLEDTVKIQNPSSRLARRGWRVACYGPRTPPSSR